MADRFVLEPVRLILSRPALQIPHGLADRDDDRSIRAPAEAQGLDVRADDGPLTRPVFADRLAAVDVAALHASGPGDVIGECIEHTVDVAHVEAVIDGPENLVPRQSRCDGRVCGRGDRAIRRPARPTDRQPRSADRCALNRNAVSMSASHVGRGDVGDMGLLQYGGGPRDHRRLGGIQSSGSPNRSRSAISPGPVGSQPSFLRVCSLEAGMSCPANIASQPK